MDEQQNAATTPLYGPRAFLALSDSFRRTLDLIHGPDSDEPAHLQKAILDGVAAIEAIDRARGMELRDAGSKLFGRLHTYEVDVTKRANDKAVSNYKQQQKKDAKKGDHDSGSADSIEWLDPLPEAEIEAMLVLDASDAAREQLVRSTDGRSGAYLFDLADEAGREAIVAGVEVAQSHVFWAIESVPVPDEFSNALTGKKAEPKAMLIM